MDHETWPGRIAETPPGDSGGCFAFSVPRRIFFFLLVVLSGAALFLWPDPARAQCQNCGCVYAESAATDALIVTQHEITKQWVTSEFSTHRQDFILGYWFNEEILGALRMMTEQLVSAAMLQTMAVGSFFDAKQQLETQRLAQELTAAAHKDYHPGNEMCALGTATQSLGETNRRARLTAAVLSKRSQDRQLGNVNTAAQGGPADDRAGRIEQLKRRFCDKNDNNGAQIAVCSASATPDTINKDIDYTRTLALPLTLKVDFSGAGGAENEDVVALGSNLFAHDIFKNVSPALYKEPENQSFVLDLRSIVAKRSVAENSFAHIVGLKSQGSALSAHTAGYLNAALRQLAVSEDEAKALLGERPSYHAQMEVLSKKLYQRPEFYIGLYDTPANTQRKGAALQAIALMQNTDKFQSQLRNEMMLSVLLELELKKPQDEIENRLGRVEATGGTGTQ